MSGLFSKPKTPKPVPVPDEGDTERADEELRRRIASRQGRRSTLLAARKDTGPQGTRPRGNTLLGGGT